MGFLQALLGIVQCAAGAEIATGTYVYRNHYAGLLEMSLPFAVMLGVHVLTQNRDHLRSPARPAVQACPRFGSAVAILVSVIESQSRMGFTASMAALFVIGALAARSRHSTKGASGRRAGLVVGAVAIAGTRALHRCPAVNCSPASPPFRRNRAWFRRARQVRSSDDPPPKSGKRRTG